MEKEQKMRDYWLKRLSESDLDYLENIWTLNDHDSELLLTIRGEIIEEFFKGELSAGDEHLFKKNFVTVPTNQQELQIAHSFQQTINTAEVEKYLSEDLVEKKSLWLYLTDFLKISRPLLITGVLILGILMVGLLVLRTIYQPIEVAIENPNVPSLEPVINQNRELPENSDSANQVASPTSTVKTPSASTPIPKSTTEKTPLNDSSSVTTPKPQLTPEKLPTPQPLPSPAAEKTMILVLATVLRGNEPTRQIFTIPENINKLTFQFKMRGLIERYIDFKFKIVSATKGTIVYNGRLEDLNNKKVGVEIFVNIPARSIENGDYDLIVYGERADKTTEDIYHGAFTINKK